MSRRSAELGPLDEFRRQFLAPTTHRETLTPSTAVLSTLSPSERLVAKSELLSELEKHAVDRRVLLALGYLRIQAAVPLLREHLQRNNGPQTIQIAGALWAICRDQQSLELLRGVLRGERFGGAIIERTWAITELSRVPDPVGVRVLSEALEDHDGVVRMAATQACARLLGMDDALKRYETSWRWARSRDERHEAFSRLKSAVLAKVTEEVTPGAKDRDEDVP